MDGIKPSPNEADQKDPHILLGRVIDAATDLAHLALRSASAPQPSSEPDPSEPCGWPVTSCRFAASESAASGTAKVPLDPTPAMVEAGAQRLVRWETGAEKWPDAWSALDVRTARNDAERCWRSMWLEATGQGSDG